MHAFVCVCMRRITQNATQTNKGKSQFETQISAPSRRRAETKKQPQQHTKDAERSQEMTENEDDEPGEDADSTARSWRETGRTRSDCGGV